MNQVYCLFYLMLLNINIFGNSLSFNTVKSTFSFFTSAIKSLKPEITFLWTDFFRMITVIIVRHYPTISVKTVANKIIDPSLLFRYDFKILIVAIFSYPIATTKLVKLFIDTIWSD